MHRVLVADDDHVFIDEIQVLLTAAGYEFKVVTSGGQAVYQLLTDKDNYDCAILDVHLAGLNGIDTAKMLRKVNPKLPIVVVSEDEDLHMKVKCSCLGINHFVTRPLDKETLMQAIESVCKAAQERADV